jgi:hypothetical protein
MVSSILKSKDNENLLAKMKRIYLKFDVARGLSSKQFLLIHQKSRNIINKINIRDGYQNGKFIG